MNYIERHRASATTPLKEYDPKLFRTKRQTLGMTEQEVADICHLSRQTIGNIEHGRVTSGASIMLVGLVLDMCAMEQEHLMHIFEFLDNSSQKFPPL